jgi:hypothetical protein
MLQGITPAFDRGLAKALNYRWVVFRETLQREQAVAVVVDAIARGIERFHRNAALTRLPGQLPDRTDHRVDPAAGKVGKGLARLDRQGSQLVRIDRLGLKRSAQFDIESVARREPPDPAVEQRPGRREVAIGAIINPRVALLKDRRQQQQ